MQEEDYCGATDDNIAKYASGEIRASVEQGYFVVIRNSFNFLKK